MTKKHYNSESLRIFQKNILDKNGGHILQKDFLERVVSENKEFVSWLNKKIFENVPEGEDFIIGDGEPAMPNSPPQYTAQEYKNPPLVTSRSMWEAWHDMDIGSASNPCVWGYIVSKIIESGKIKPHCLMAENGDSDGRKEIDSALKEKNDSKRIKMMDNCVRSFLRRFCGVIERGARSLYVDCPPARVWWQHHMAEQIAKNTGGNGEEIVELLRRQPVWAKLCEKMASRLTVIGDVNIRDGLIDFLMTDEGKVFAKNQDNLEILIKNIGIMCAWRALGYFQAEEVREIILTEIAPNLTTQ